MKTKAHARQVLPRTLELPGRPRPLTACRAGQQHMRKFKNIYALLFLFVLAASGCAKEVEMPCLTSTNVIYPLLMGDTARVPVGVMVNTDCNPTVDPGYVWSTADVAIIQVTPDGIIKGIAPGTFGVTATRGKTILSTEGFVLPSGWTLKFEPASATVRVGQSVTIDVIAMDAMGRDIPGIPFHIFTPEFFKPQLGSSAYQIVDKRAYQNNRAPVLIRALRPGSTMLKGMIGARSTTFLLTILPADGTT